MLKFKEFKSWIERWKAEQKAKTMCGINRPRIMTKQEGERQVREWNALLQNAIRSPMDTKQTRDIAWVMCDILSEMLILDIKPPEPDLPQDSVFL